MMMFRMSCADTKLEEEVEPLPPNVCLEQVWQEQGNMIRFVEILVFPEIYILYNIGWLAALEFIEFLALFWNFLCTGIFLKK